MEELSAREGERTCDILSPVHFSRAYVVEQKMSEVSAIYYELREKQKSRETYDLYDFELDTYVQDPTYRTNIPGHCSWIVI